MNVEPGIKNNVKCIDTKPESNKNFYVMQ